MTPKERREHRRLRLIELIDVHYKNNQALFADAAQIAANLVSRYVNGSKGIGEDMRNKIEINTGFAGWFDGVSQQSSIENTEPGPGIAGTVPLISWVAAGDWASSVDNLQPGDGERVPTTYRVRRHTYALRVKGDSMEPKFPDGAILIVEPDEEPLPGKFVIVRQNGDTEAVFKQLVQDGGTLYLKPLNDRYPILQLRPDAVFCGVVKRIEMDV